MLRSEAVPCVLCGGDPEAARFCHACDALGFTIELEHEPLERLMAESPKHDE